MCLRTLAYIARMASTATAPLSPRMMNNHIIRMVFRIPKNSRDPWVYFPLIAFSTSSAVLGSAAVILTSLPSAST
jgi:hypothetical protein